MRNLQQTYPWVLYIRMGLRGLIFLTCCAVRFIQEFVKSAARRTVEFLLRFYQEFYFVTSASIFYHVEFFLKSTNTSARKSW